MDGRRLIESLVPEIAPNASVVGVEERERHYSVTIAGTTGVLGRRRCAARCRRGRGTFR